MFLKKLAIVTAATIFTASSALAAIVPNTKSNVVFIVDESGSMAGEQAFLSSTVGKLDAALAAAGVTDRSYGVVGYGNGGFTTNLGRVVGSGLTDAATAATNLGSLGTGGFFEDGYSGIDFAIKAFNYTAGAAINFILVTDEDRDDGNAALTFTSIKNAMTSRNILLNAVVNAQFSSNGTGAVLGVDSTGEAYIANGTGGFTTATGGTNTSSAGTTDVDYVQLANATGGAAWNLNFIDAGGTNLDSFTNAFVDIKVREIITQPPTGGEVPLPAAGWLLLAAVGGLGVAKRRKAA